MTVVVVGASSWNTLVLLDRLPDPHPHTVTAAGHHDTLGGTSAGKALHLADLAVPVTLVTVVGDDEDADRILGELARPGIDVIPVRGTGPSEHHLNLMTPRGERLSIYLDHAPSASPGPSVDARVDDAIGAARVIALDLAELGRALIPRIGQAAGAVWVDLHDYDGVNAYHSPFLAAADVVLMNGDAIGDPVTFLRSLVGDRIVAGVCTLGADGAVGVASDGTVVRVPAARARVRDTNGAGDAFMAGMIASTVGAPGAAVPVGPNALETAMARGATQAVRALESEHIAPR